MLLFFNKIKEDPNLPWPASPGIYYKNQGWVSYLDLFGKPEKISLDELKQDVKLKSVVDSLILAVLETTCPSELVIVENKPAPF